MKLSAQQVADSMELDMNDVWDPVEEKFTEDCPSLDKEVDETVYRTTVMRKEIRTRAQRERGEIVGRDGSKHRKY